MRRTRNDGHLRPEEEFGPNGFDQAVAEVGAVLCIPPAAARKMIITGQTMRYRLPCTGLALASGRIDLDRFMVVVTRTAVCSEVTVSDVDALLSQAILGRDQMSMTRFTALVDRILAKCDPLALERRAAAAHAGRNVSVRPDRHTPGRSRLSAGLRIEDGAVIDARLNTMADGVHRADPRNRGQRRADALIALAQGGTVLECRCPDCTTPSEDTADDVDAAVDAADHASAGTNNAATDNTDADVDAVVDVSASDDENVDDGVDNAGTAQDSTPTAPEAEACTCKDRTSAPVAPTFHIVVNLSTLLGQDEDPGFLDGLGVIDAATARSLLEGARRSYIHPDHEASARAAFRYPIPTRLAALIKAGELCCAFPGCNNRVTEADLDHTVPFNHTNPSAGGWTVRWNLKPLCRFHHRIKTFGHWRDIQGRMGQVMFQSPTGHTYVGNSFTGIDLFPMLAPDKPPGHPVRELIEAPQRRKRAVAEEAERQWNRDNPPPF